MRGQVRSKASDQPVPGLDHMLETLDGDGDGQVTRGGRRDALCSAARRGSGGEGGALGQVTLEEYRASMGPEMVKAIRAIGPSLLEVRRCPRHFERPGLSTPC
jgi:biotin carboxylase